MALITAAQARLALPALTGTTEDTNLETVIGRAGAILAAWCGYPSATAGAAPTMETTSYILYNGLGGLVHRLDSRHLRVDVWPVTAITSIYDDTTEAYGTAVTSTNYTLIKGDEGLIALTLASGLSWNDAGAYYRNLKVTVTAGWATVPPHLAQAAMMLTKHLWENRRTQGVVSTNQGGTSVTVREAEHILPEDVRALVSPLRLPRVHLAA